MEENLKYLPYELVYNENKKDKKELFSNVIGHDEQKKELLLVVEWFDRVKELKKKNITIPKGVILFGEPGNGKTLLIREIINHCKVPVLLYKGGKNYTGESINETFKKAKEIGHSIIVFDELDLILGNSSEIRRAFQENLDGVESFDDIFVLAATNDIYDIPKALLREGRFEKRIHIPYLSTDETLELFKFYCNQFNLELPNDLNFEDIRTSMHYITCAGVKSIVNDLVLRNGFNDITSEMIYKSIYNITEKVIRPKKRDTNLNVAIHESGHAVVANLYPQFYKIKSVEVDGYNGSLKMNEIEEGFSSYEKSIAEINISLSGIIAEKVICKSGSRGCGSDLQDARKMAYNLMNISGYSSCWETLPEVSSYSRQETQIKRRRMEKKIEGLLKRCEKFVTNCVIDNQEKIQDLANALLEKKYLSSSEVLSIIC